MDPFATTCALGWPPVWAPDGSHPAAAPASPMASNASATGQRRRAPRPTSVPPQTAEARAAQPDGWTLDAVVMSF